MLVGALAARVAAARKADPLQPVTVVVPDASIDRHLRFRLAEQHGIAANLETVRLRTWLQGLIESADPNIQVLDTLALQLMIFGRIQDPDTLDEELRPVRGWLRPRDFDPSEGPRRALQLAGHLARLYEEYAFSRRGMLKAWGERSTLAHGGWATSERWQRRLWMELFTPEGRARIDGAHRALLPDALAAVKPALLKLPETLHVFGLSYVAPAFAEIFSRLAQRCELRIYALNPCLEFWEDVDTGFRAAREGLARRGERVTSREGEDPFSLLRATDPPALRLWGRPGREYVRLLNQLSDCDFAAGFVDPGEATLLTRLQRDILVRAPAEPSAPDDSIGLLACPSLRREVEAVADQIWALVQQHEGLRFHQIAVSIVGDRREAYLAHIQGVFRERHDIPYNLVDQPLAGQSRVLEAVLRLLELPASRFELATVMRLALHPCVGRADPEADPDRWRAWVEALRIKFGADAEDLQKTYLDRDPHTWAHGLRRLALGAFMAGEGGGDPRTYETDEGGWLPLDLADDASPEAARFLALVGGLIEDAKAVQGRALGLGAWAVYFARLVTTWVQPVGVADEQALRRVLMRLEGLGEADLRGDPLPFELAAELATRHLAGLESARGQHQADGVVVGALAPMRAIPYEVIFVLGLDEGAFPARPRQDPLDLRRAKRQAGDVRPPERDRYLFLETLLAARRHLFLSWVGRDGSTGEPREPSPVVRELEHVLRAYLGDGVGALCREFPVSPYEAGPLPNTSPHAREGAQALHTRASIEAALGQAPPGPGVLMAQLNPEAARGVAELIRPPLLREGDYPKELDLPLSALAGFLQSPLQGAARYALGLAEDDWHALESDPDEPLAMDYRVRQQVLDQAFWAGAGDPDKALAAYKTLYERQVLRGEAPVGMIGARRQVEDEAVLDHWHQNTSRLPFELQDWESLHIGRAPEHGEPLEQIAARSGAAYDPVILPPIRLTLDAPWGAPLQVSLHGPLPRLHPSGAGVLRCLLSQGHRDDHALPGFMAMVALRALDRPLPEPFRVVVCPARLNTGRLTRKFRVPPPDAARAWLTGLVGDLLFQGHAYRLPIQAVFQWHNRSRGGLADFKEFRGRSSDDFGPLAQPKSFRPLEDREAMDLAQRRFWLWFEAAAGSE